MTNHKTPLSRAFSLKPGSYSLAILVSDPIVDPGGRLQIEVYISGYGVIQAAKVAFYPSPNVFNIDKSTVWHSLKTYEDGKMGWGAEQTSLDPVGMVCCLSGGIVFETNTSQKATWFFDARPEEERENYQISTEVKHPKGKSPLFMDLRLHRKARSGQQSISFVFTYFDGDTWRSCTDKADFTVRSFYERHQTSVWLVGGLIGGIAGFFSILANAANLWPHVKVLWDTILFFF